MDDDWQCPRCGSSAAAGSYFCRICGARLDAEATGATVPAGGAAFATTPLVDPYSIGFVPERVGHVTAEPPVAGWRWAALIVNCALLCVWLTLSAWNWRDPPRNGMLPVVPVPTVTSTPSAIDGTGPVETVPPTTPRPASTPTHATSSGGSGGPPSPPPTPPTSTPPTPTLVPTATATPAPTATPTSAGTPPPEG